MTIVMTGGGSGGHITPVLAVAAEIKSHSPETRIIYIGQKGDKLLDIPQASPYLDEVITVRAGKFRRYHGAGIAQIFDFKTLFLNIRDACNLLAGVVQSYSVLRKIRPAVIFTRGASVSVPVGFAAARLNIPYVTHDSDAIPSLANRLIAKHAILHAVALPEEVYTSYPADKTKTFGIPLRAEFRAVSNDEVALFRREIGIPEKSSVVLLTGGGHGAQRLNTAFAQVAPALLHDFPDLHIIHIAGRGHEAELSQWYARNIEESLRARVSVHGFVDNLYAYSGASDLVITRAGWTSISEFGLQEKACIVVPNPQLTGGHQTKNAEYLASKAAAEVLLDMDVTKSPGILGQAVATLLHDSARRTVLAKNLSAFAHPRAAQELAMVLLDIGKKHSKQT